MGKIISRKIFILLAMFFCLFLPFKKTLALPPSAGTDSVTVSLWVYPKGSVASKAIVVKDNEIRIVTDASGNITCQYYTLALGWRGGVSTTQLALNSWQHVACVFQKGQKTIYVQGTKVSSEVLSIGTYNFNNTTNSWKVGHDDSMTYGDFQGTVDNVLLYDYARSPKQIVEDMNAGHPVGGSPIGSQVAYYKFDEGKGQTAYDSSPNHNDLQLGATSGAESTDPTWTNSGKFGRALSYVRASQQYAYINDNATLSLASDLTVSGWIKPTSNVAGAQYDIINKWGSGAPSYLLSQFGSELKMDINTSGNYKKTSGVNLQVGQWYYVAGVYNASAQTVTLYINGVDAGGTVTGTIPSSITNVGGRLYVGDGPTPGSYFDGVIDEVKVYASALTPEQIKLDMNQGKELQLGGQSSATGATGQAAEYCVPGDATSCAGPVGEWKFDEGSGGSVADTSGNGRDGTLTNSPAWTVAGKYNSGIKMTANSNQSVVVDSSKNPLPGLSQFTIETWANREATLSTALMAFGAGGEYWRSVSDSEEANLYLLDSDCNNGGQVWHLVNAFLTGWHHYALSIETDGTLKLYRDGALFATTNYSSYSGEAWDSMCPTASNLTIGNYAGTEGWGGTIDDFKIFNYARTPAQIAWDFNRGKPVGWWKMDEGEGDKAYDSSGNGNTGTLTTMDPPNDWVAGKFGKALDFDGTNDYISAGTAPTFDSTRQYSWSSWIKWTGFSKSTQCYFSKDRLDPKTTGYNLCLNQTSSTADPIICKGDTLGSMACSNGLNLNLPSDSWINLSTVYDGAGNWKIYKNGQYMGTETLSVTSDTTAKYFIGAGNGVANSGVQVPDYFFTGQIDDVRVYNYALTAEQVKQVMNEGSAVRFGE
jgi:hypothetical protein